MADLVAQGPKPDHRWRRQIPESEESLDLGRQCSGWSVPWDSNISRCHATLRMEDQRLHVTKVANAANPIFFEGVENDNFYVEAGQHFVIGKTTFSLTREQVYATLETPDPVSQESFSSEYLRQIHYRDADRRITVLSQLPEIISSASNDQDLFIRLGNVLLTGISSATTVAFVKGMLADPSTKNESDDDIQIKILHWDRRVLSSTNFQPSARLIRQAIETGKTVLHVWSGSGESSPMYTMDDQNQWAFASPLSGSACRGWAIYVSGNTTSLAGQSGSGSDPADLRGDIKFAELVGATLENLRQVKELERSQAGLRTFFSPVVLDALVGRDPEDVLSPRECEVTVMFCDLRGFSRTSERLAADLIDLLNRVSRALGVTTHNILAQRGVVGDFHGDAAMGFWGWPLHQPDAAQRACVAALEIQKEFMKFEGQSDHPLQDFQIGIGIATGRAVAGKIGTSDQVKVTVFGPVVNLAARLETMTKTLRAPIIVDEATLELLRESELEYPIRTRRLAVVRPYGMKKPMPVSQIMPPYGPNSVLTDEHLRIYESAVENFVSGDWDTAFDLLHQVPSEDQAKDFLTVLIAQENRMAPSNWDGVISLKQK